jgi:hypothetical protein
MKIGKYINIKIKACSVGTKFLSVDYQHGTWMEMAISYNIGHRFLSIPSIVLPAKERIKDEIRRNS